MSNPTASSTVGLATAPHVISVDLFNSMRTRLQNLSVEQGRARGSFLVVGEQFDRWLASVYSGAGRLPFPNHDVDRITTDGDGPSDGSEASFHTHRRDTDEKECIGFDIPSKVDRRRPGWMRACDLDPVSAISEVWRLFAAAGFGPSWAAVIRLAPTFPHRRQTSQGPTISSPFIAKAAVEGAER